MMSVPPPCDLAWAAGFIEGEGYFCLQPVHNRASDGWKNRKPRIEVSQTRIAPLENLQRMFGGKVLKLVARKNRKQTWRWDLCGGESVERCLSSIHPFMISRRQEVDVLLEYIDTMNLNRRGGRMKRVSDELRAKRQALFEKLKEVRSGS